MRKGSLALSVSLSLTSLQKTTSGIADLPLGTDTSLHGEAFFFFFLEGMVYKYNTSPWLFCIDTPGRWGLGSFF